MERVPDPPQTDQEAIQSFLRTASRPALVEPGEPPIELTPGSYTLELTGVRLMIHAWDRDRNLVRRIRSVKEATAGRLRLEVEKFGKKTGSVELVDLQKPSSQTVTLKATRAVGRERLRRSLLRQFPGWRVTEVSSDADLEHSLSPAYPRAVLQKGTTAWAAILAPPEQTDIDGVLSFGLIWLAYIRQRERKLAVAGLVVFLPEGQHQNTCLRLLYLDHTASEFRVFIYGAAFEEPVDLTDYGNVQSSLPSGSFLRPIPERFRPLSEQEGVETITRPDGVVHWQVNGLDFARWDGTDFLFGIETIRQGSASNVPEILSLARELYRVRSYGASDRAHPLLTRNPESWLESRVRAELTQIDASLIASPVYGQVPAVLTSHRGVMDLLACDFSGRLAVVEVKASEDLHLPLQSLDYWIRVSWHLERGAFQERGFFPGRSLRKAPPRMLMVFPVLHVHPTTDTILGFFRPDIEIEQIGVAMDWAREIRVMLRKSHNQRREHP